MQLAHAARIAWWRHTEQCIASWSEPVIEDWTQFRKRPHRQNWPQPTPARQDANHFDPGKVTFAPATICGARVHRFSHFFARVWRGALQNLWIVIIQPLDAMIAIKRLDARSHPETEI